MDIWFICRQVWVYLEKNGATLNRYLQAINQNKTLTSVPTHHVKVVFQGIRFNDLRKFSSVSSFD